MMPTKVACPRCRSVLQSSEAVPPGKRIACLKCGAPFTVTANGVAVASAPETQPEVALKTVPEMGGSTPMRKPAVLVAAPFAPPPLPVPACQPKPALPPAAQRAATPILQAKPFAPPPRAPQNRGLILTLIVGGALLFVGTGVVLALCCFGGGMPEAETQAVAVNPSPAVNAQQTAPAPPQQVVPVPVPEPAPPEPPALEEPKPGTPKRKKGGSTPPPAIPPVVEVKGGVPVNVSSLPPAEQQRVNEAIDHGVKYLRNSQFGNGTWDTGAHPVGYAALPGLTLLECGEAPKDSAVQKAAQFVRARSVTLTHTYQLSLAVLFLDRLGDPQDKKLIQTLALRLVAGQNSAGGWDYNCPILSTPDEKHLLTFLQQNRPQRLPDPLAGKAPGTLPDPLGKNDPNPLTDPLGKTQPGTLTDPLGKKQPGTLPEAIPGKGDPARPKTEQKLGVPVQPNSPAGDGAKPAPAPQAKPGEPLKTVKIPPKVEKARPDFLPPNLRNLPIAQKGGKGKKAQLAPAGRDDNSNTQFAIMALWVARRHDVPMEQTLALVEQRFRVSQTSQGGWAYQFRASNQTGPMTCVGLLGLAIGHGSEVGALGSPPGKAAPPPQDQAIQRGLRALGQYLDHPGKRPNATMVSTYFLWSVERVGVAYNLKTIGNKDWYRWGVEILLPTQNKKNGSWFSRGYPGSSTQMDTCMALLFLKRANFVQDLTEHLQLYMPITDPDAPGARHK